MSRTLFACWLCVVVLGVLVGWTARGSQERAERRALGHRLYLCGACFGCRGGDEHFCSALESEGFGRAICSPAPTEKGADL